VELAETRDVLRNIKYPFDTFIQSSERVDSLTDFLNEFLTQNELFNSSKKERYVTLISSYVKNCSLPESSSDTLATTALLLAIYFCVNDKLKLSLVQDGPWIRQLSQLLTDDNREGYSPTPLNRAMMLFVDRLNLVPASQHIKAEFVTFLSKAFTAMLERSISSGTINSLDQYEINRSDDIFVRPYIALLRVLNNITLSPTFSSSSERLDMDNSVIRAIYISNDVFSLDRDIRSGADNYISIHSRITGDSLTQSEVKTLREHNKEVAVFSSQLEACVLKSGFLGPSERKYLQLLQISLTGNYLSMQECAFRYSVKA
jgi:hypothetical protein